MQNPEMGCTFLQLNRNKRSVVLDLKIERHMEAMRDLLAGADVFMYSVRPQAMARLGLGPDHLADLNPKLISVSLVGFGEGGPYAGRPAYEDLIQGLTAMPSLLARTGSPEPGYVPTSFNDRGTGLWVGITHGRQGPQPSEVPDQVFSPISGPKYSYFGTSFKVGHDQAFINLGL